MSDTGTRPVAWWPMIVAPAVALSIGWGIRGNFGHEHGAMIPGVLAALAAVIASGRADWQRRAAYFAAFGGLGWAFGGMISYMQVIAYTHSGHSPTVLYGFACLFLIGFLWAAIGGAATALPAFLTRERLTELFGPVIAWFTVLVIHDLTYDSLNAWLARVLTGTTLSGNPDYRQQEPLYWLDATWTSALLAIVVVLVYCSVRRRIDRGSSLVLHMAVGWWVSFLLFPVLLVWRMTPPRGDNWAGNLGMVVGMWIFLQRNGLRGVTYASLVAGFVGGAGFALATLFKLIEVSGGAQTNWHSILEQTYGLINGIGIGLTMLLLRSRTPVVTDDPPVRRWTDWFAPAIVLLLIPYLNARKNPEEWVKVKAMPEVMSGLQPITWFNIAWIAIAAAGIWLLISHARRPLALLPATWLGKAQLMLLAFLWYVVFMNFERALVDFAPVRLVTEGTIQMNAVILTLLALLMGRSNEPTPADGPPSYSPLIRRTAVLGLAGTVACVLLSWGTVRAIYGDRFAGYAGLHIRFGPHATATTAKPKPNQPHP